MRTRGKAIGFRMQVVELFTWTQSQLKNEPSARGIRGYQRSARYEENGHAVFGFNLGHGPGLGASWGRMRGTARAQAWLGLNGCGRNS